MRRRSKHTRQAWLLVLCLSVGLIGGINEGASIEDTKVGTAQTEMHFLREAPSDYRHVFSSRQADTTPAALLGVRLDARLVPLATPTLPDVPLAAPIPPAEALPVVSRQLPSSVEAIIAARFNESPYGADYWIAVARCESSLRPSAIGHGETYIGLFQVWLNHGYGYAWLLDPYNNTLAAWELSHEGTYTGAWPYCQWVR